MTRSEEDDLRPRRRLGPDAVELRRELGLGAPEVESRERAERLPEGRRVRPDDGRQLVEDPLDLGLHRHLRLAPGVAELDGHERFDEERLAAARRVVDDALDPASGVRLHRHDVASVAEGDDGLLERTAELRADERVEAPLQSVVGDPDRRPEPAEARGCGVEQLAGRVEAAGERAPEGRQWVQVVAEIAEERPALVGKGRPEARRRVERIGDLEEPGRIDPSTAGGPLDPRSDIVGGADTDTGPFGEEGTGLVGLVEAAGDDHRIGRRLEGLGQSPTRPERGHGGEPLADGGELEQGDRAGVHRGQPVADERLRGPDAAGLPATTYRHGTEVHGSPA